MAEESVRTVVSADITIPRGEWGRRSPVGSVTGAPGVSAIDPSTGPDTVR